MTRPAPLVPSLDAPRGVAVDDTSFYWVNDTEPASADTPSVFKGRIPTTD